MAPAATGKRSGKAAKIGQAIGKAAGKVAGKVAKATKSAKSAAPAKPSKVAARSKVPFPKKNQPPSEAEFVARLPLAAGKKFEGVRSFLGKQRGVTEDLYFYGPKTGWAYRYRHGTHSLATIMIHGDRLVGIVALDAAALGEIDFTALSDVGERARRLAHGSPALSWLDLPLDGPGASDFKVLLKAKLRTLPEILPPSPATEARAEPSRSPLPPPPPPAPTGSRRARTG
jgi:hypothetical protein